MWGLLCQTKYWFVGESLSSELFGFARTQISNASIGIIAGEFYEVKPFASLPG
jgi:hypothetical protein